MTLNLIMTGIYLFSWICLFVAWARYHQDWSCFRETVHVVVMLCFWLAAVVTAFMAGRARRRKLREPK